MLTYRDEQYLMGKEQVPVPRVSDVLNLIDPFLWGNEERRQLGKAAHNLTAEWDRSKKIIDHYLLGYLTGWIKFKNETKFKVLEIEKPIYSKKYKIAGTPDRIGIPLAMYKHKTVVDIKIGVQVPVAPVQTAGYKILYNEDKKLIDQVRHRLVVYLDGDNDYKLYPHEDISDRLVFLSGLTILNWKKVHK